MLGPAESRTVSLAGREAASHKGHCRLRRQLRKTKLQLEKDDTEGGCRLDEHRDSVGTELTAACLLAMDTVSGGMCVPVVACHRT
jgi:hypothetical protein